MRTIERVSYTLLKAECDSCHQKVEVKDNQKAYQQAIEGWASVSVRIVPSVDDVSHFDFCNRCINDSNSAYDDGVDIDEPDVWSLIRTAMRDLS